jgi:hypothetical protein
MIKKMVIFISIFLLFLIPLISSHVCNDVVSGQPSCQGGCPDAIGRDYIGSEITANGINITVNISVNNFRWTESTQSDCICSLSNNSDNIPCLDMTKEYPSPRYCCDNYFCWYSGFDVLDFRYTVYKGDPRALNFSEYPKTPIHIDTEGSKIFNNYIEIKNGTPSQEFEIRIAVTPQLMSRKGTGVPAYTNVARPICTISFYWDANNSLKDKKIYFNETINLSEKNKQDNKNSIFTKRNIIIGILLLFSFIVLIIYHNKIKKNIKNKIQKIIKYKRL